MNLKLRNLSFPEYSFKIKNEHGHFFIYDQVRKKHVALTPEEWVRQHMIMYLIYNQHFPASRISVEHSLKINQMSHRADIVFFGKFGQPFLVVECKAPDVNINQKVFDQVVRYNYNLKVNIIIVTNGLHHYCCNVDYESQTCDFLQDIPDYRFIAED